MRVRISARQSDLAKLQAYRVGEALKSVGATEVTFQFRSSLGDLNQSDPLWKMPEKGVFTEDFVRDLTEGTADMVVHSWKDLPTIQRVDTEIVATLPRADTRDLLLFRRDRLANHSADHDASQGDGHLKILTSSPRRAYNLEQFFLTHLPRPAKGTEWKSVEFQPVRGNIPTRLKKLLAQDVDGLIVAKAALDRLIAAAEPEFAETQAVIRDVLAQTLFMVLPLSVNPTAAAQGALAIEIHKDRPELAALVAKLNCPKTFEAVVEERKILALYGGGCHQKIGVTILERDYGKLTYLRGLTDRGERLDRLCLEAPAEAQALPGAVPEFIPESNASASSQPLANEAIRIFPEAGEEGSFFERELFTGTELEATLGKLSGCPAIYVARENALPLEHHPASHQLIWTAGLRTWQKLAARGVWVNGSSESLGEREPMQIDALVQAQGRQGSGSSGDQNSLEWTKVSHEDSARTSASEFRSLATYRLKPRARLPDLRDRTHFYWMSGSSFERAVALFPEIQNKIHVSGPGHTHDFLVRALGSTALKEGRILIALDLESWRNGFASHK